MTFEEWFEKRGVWPRLTYKEVWEAGVSSTMTQTIPKGCDKPLAKGQWWGFCGETDMGQTMPALCTHCGGAYILKEDGDT